MFTFFQDRNSSMLHLKNQFFYIYQKNLKSNIYLKIGIRKILLNLPKKEKSLKNNWYIPKKPSIFLKKITQKTLKFPMLTQTENSKNVPYLLVTYKNIFHKQYKNLV